jgi:hypothetical protein
VLAVFIIIMLAVNPLDIAALNAVKSIERSTRKSAKIGRDGCMIGNYLHNPPVVISVNVQSASCRCRLIQENLGFIHAAATTFV